MVSVGHRFDCTLTIGTTALCNASHVVFLARENVFKFCQAVVKFRWTKMTI